MEALRVFAGDTVTWTRSIPGYSAADGFSAVYYLRNKENVYGPLVCSADGTTFTLAVSAADSAGWVAGVYAWTLFAKKGETDRYLIDKGEITVDANPDSAAGQDVRTFAQKMVDLLEELLTKVAATPHTNLSVSTSNSRSVTYKSLEEVSKELTRYRRQVRAEKDAARVARGERSRRISTVKFTG